MVFEEETPRPPYNPERGEDGWPGEAHCYIYAIAWWIAIGREEGFDKPIWYNKDGETKIKGRPDIDFEKNNRLYKRWEVERFGKIEREIEQLEEKRLSLVASKVDYQCRQRHKGEIVFYVVVRRDGSEMYIISMAKAQKVGKPATRKPYNELENFYMVDLEHFEKVILRDAEFLGKEKFDACYKSLCSKSSQGRAN
jgi:hypothetical protein